MKMNRAGWALGIGWMCFAAAVGAQAPAPSAPPIILHEPATVVVRGQPLSIIAKVRPGAGELKSVLLYYTVSRDAAPFKLAMQDSGASVYYGSIPAHLLGSAPEVSYYLEAMNDKGETAETDWFTVAVKDARAVGESAPAPVAAPMAPVTSGTAGIRAPAPAPASEGHSLGSWATLGLIGGAAIAVVGGAIYLANKDSGGDDNSGDKAGTYIGSETLCYSVAGGSPTCSRNSVQIVIDANGGVQSSDLFPGSDLTGNLNGNSFLLVAQVNESASNRTGEVYFTGTVIEGKIVGSIDGHATEPAGEGQYTGTFDATKM